VRLRHESSEYGVATLAAHVTGMRLIETWRRKRNLHYVVESANRFGLRRRKIDLFALITTEKQKRQTEWRRRLDSNSRLRFPTHFPVMFGKSLYPSSPSSYLYRVARPRRRCLRVKKETNLWSRTDDPAPRSLPDSPVSHSLFAADRWNMYFVGQ